MAAPEAILDAIDDTFRDFTVDGVPASGAHKPVKSSIRSTLKVIAGLAAVSGSGRAVETVADLAGITDPAVNDAVMVIADPSGDVEDGNGFWAWDGSAWQWLGPLTAQAVFDYIDQQLAAGEGAAGWVESADIALGTDVIQAAFVGQSGKVRLAMMESGRLLSQRQFNLFHDDPEIAGAVVLSNLESAFLLIPQLGSARAPVIRGRPRSGLPAAGVVTYYGQSNVNAAFSGIATPEDTRWGDWMLGTHIQTWDRGSVNATTPENREDGFLALYPVVERDDGVQRMEFGAFGVSAGLKITGAGGRFLSQDASDLGPRIVYHCPSTGGIYLSQLLKGAGFGFYETFVDDVARAKGQAALHGYENFAHLGVVFDQGEAEADMKLEPSGSALTWQEVVDGYVDEFAELDADLTEDIGAVTGQSGIVWFLTQMRYGPAAQAHDRLARENDNVFLVGPRYHMPQSLNSIYQTYLGDWTSGDSIHMSADSQRWRGEMVGRVMRRVLTEGRDWKPLHPVRVWRVDGTTVRVQYHVPSPPIQISDIAMPLLQRRGFAVRLGTVGTETGSPIYPTSVTVVAPDTVEIELDADIGSSEAYLRYGQEDWISNVGPVTTVRSGSADPVAGLARTEYVLDGDHLAALEYALGYGVVTLANGEGFAYVRDVYLEGGDTVAVGWTSQRYGLDVDAGDTTLQQVIPGGNVCDSDDALSVLSFSSGPRAGQPYPLNNHSIVFWEPIQ